MQWTQYAAMMLIGILAALVLMILIGANGRLGKDKKKWFMLSALLLVLGSAAEYFGVCLDGAPARFRALHIALKVFELSLSPFLVILLVSAFNGFSHAKVLLPVALLNIAIEVSTGFTGFLYYVDGLNVYHHNSFYWIYTLVYVLCGIYFFYECALFSRQYQNRGSGSLLAILVFLVSSLSIHSAHSAVRADWPALIIAEALFYIYYTGLVEQMDSLTQLLDRKSYDMQLEELDRKAALIVFDIDSFKEVNDTYGHETGDACLRAVGSVLKRTYGKYGLCYRIGGDEFCVITSKDGIDFSAVNSLFRANLDRAREVAKDAHLPDVSFGYALFDPESEKAVDTVQRADAMMYKCKKERRAGRENESVGGRK